MQEEPPRLIHAANSPFLHGSIKIGPPTTEHVFRAIYFLGLSYFASLRRRSTNVAFPNAHNTS